MIIQDETDSYGNVDRSRITFLINTEKEPVTTHFVHVIQRVNPKTKDLYKCAYASIPFNWWNTITEDMKTEALISFIGIDGPSTHIPSEWGPIAQQVECDYWIGWDWIHISEEKQYEFGVIHRLIQQRLGLIREDYERRKKP